MNNKIYLMAAIIAFASVGALLIQPTVASAQSSMIDNILNSTTAPSSNSNDNSQPSQGSDSSSSSSSAAVPLSTSLSCGQVITQSVKLTANLDCKTDGLIVGADDI